MTTSVSPWVRSSIAVAVLIAVCCGIVARGSESKAVPDLPGYRRDEAHNKLKDAGFEKFTDDEGVGDREPAWDANWVVLEQSPAAGDKAEIDSTVRLSIAKPEDKGVRERLPVGSPVAMEMKQQDADRAAAKRQEQADQKAQQEKDHAAVVTFVESNDPMARNSVNAISELPARAEHESPKPSVVGRVPRTHGVGSGERELPTRGMPGEDKTVRHVRRGSSGDPRRRREALLHRCPADVSARR